MTKSVLRKKIKWSSFRQGSTDPEIFVHVIGPIYSLCVPQIWSELELFWPNYWTKSVVNGDSHYKNRPDFRSLTFHNSRTGQPIPMKFGVVTECHKDYQPAKFRRNPSNLKFHLNLTFGRYSRSRSRSRSDIGQKMGLLTCYNMHLVRSFYVN